VGEESYYNGSGRAYWKEVFAHARSLDGTRPMIVPNCLRAGFRDPVLELSDIVCINRYYGWYEYPGRLTHAMHVLNDEMEELHRLYKKPMMMTEFGADTIAGYHSTSDQLFTEEYQEKLLTLYIELLGSKPYVVGEHVWNFADFRTPQHFRRVVLNRKGVFTRYREPKLAAFKLKTLWAERIRTNVRQSHTLESVLS
jgi:beta-glucuronidase